MNLCVEKKRLVIKNALSYDKIQQGNERNLYYFKTEKRNPRYKLRKYHVSEDLF